MQINPLHTGLGTSHQISTAHNDRDGVLLHRGGVPVTSQGDVREEVIIEGRAGEFGDSLRDILSRSLNRDIVVLVEVDTAGLVLSLVGDTEKFTLDTLVDRTRNVLAIGPSALATRGTARTAGRRSVSVGIERTLGARRGHIPVARSSTGSRSESRGASPSVGLGSLGRCRSAEYNVSNMFRE